MKLVALEAAIRSHAGQFHCERIHKVDEKKTVDFRHAFTPPMPGQARLDVGRLRDFYDTFGSIVFYRDDRSGDAATHIASPATWTALRSDLDDWLDPLDTDERAAMLPAWIDDCLVIGEMPQTGNSILMPAAGDAAGHVYRFDHDGFEFTHCANDLIEYVEKLLAPDDALLREMATHMRFIEGDPMVQWWIRELTDNRGHVART